MQLAVIHGMPPIEVERIRDAVLHPPNGCTTDKHCASHGQHPLYFCCRCGAAFKEVQS